MAEQLDSHTLAFLSRLPLVLAPLPPLSSSASHALSSLVQPVQASALYTKCAVCRAELVGGINASFWAERGELWATCGGCGATSRRPRDAEATTQSGRQTGKAALERVKKRRRVQVKRRDEGLHPTALAAAASRDRQATPAGVAQPSGASATTASSRQASAQAKKDRKPAPSPSPSPFVPANTPSTVPSRPLPPPAAAVMTTKKRKRPKQPSGLAELLEAKKKREKEEKAGGAGLADFLQGL
ncbi:hypothetical protein JCM10450v2_005997 [Rhodotorula kratochvilovae]